MLKHRLSKICSATLIAFGMLFTGTLMQSCQDDYFYDDREPEWLGASIYDFLQNETEKGGEHTYNYFLAIIDSLDFKEVLSRTGSKTLFVADDAAFERFFQDNRWGVTGFDQFTEAQMKVILRNSMLDNAYLLDMMSNTAGDPPTPGTCLRRTTSAEAIDTIPYVTTENFTFPENKNNEYWDRFREKGMRLACDGTNPMMVHFLRDYLKANAITDEDMNILFNEPRGQQRNGNEAYIYQNKVLSSGISYDNYSDDTLTITCKNGYVYRMDNVLLPPSNMAEEIRLHKDTRLFSRILDRFSAPVYDPTLTEDYNYVHNYGGTTDSVFVLRYLNSSSDRGMTGVNPETLQARKQEGENTGEQLNFDPGWNQYKQDGSKPEIDMAAIFVPTDEQVYKFFAEGTGKDLIQQFAPDVPLSSSDYMSIAPALDSIPNDIIIAFVNNLMQGSFVTSVPSKFDKVTNDAFEPIGLTKNDEKGDVKECVVANNGVIYILNNVFGPAKYRAVSGAPLVLENMSIMHRFIDDLKYDSYLLAMDATYSLLVPDNKYFVYYDPATIGKTQPEMWEFNYNANYSDNPANTAKLWIQKLQFDPVTYEIVDTIGKPIQINNVKDGGTYENRATDLLEYLIIVGDVEDGNKYYQAKGYGTVKCVNENGEIKFYGGEQLERGVAINVAEDGRIVKDNGIVYCTVPEDENTNRSGIVTPPTKSVYARIAPQLNNGFEEFKEFYTLCTASGLEDMFRNAYNISNKKELTDSANRYSIFVAGQNNKSIPLYEQVVQFFNTYHYTVYIPTNESIQQLYAEGLPTWEMIEEAADSAVGHYGKAVSATRLLNKLVRYHFQDNSIYVDNKPFSITSAGQTSSYANFETAALDDKTGRFYETTVRTENGTLAITDDMGNKAVVLNSPSNEGITWNVMTRDLLLSGGGMTADKASNIETSSFAVLHQIDRPLLNEGLYGYDGKFRRFANDGELVQPMEVKGGVNGEIDGANTYLVGYCNTIVVTDADGNEEYQTVGYLMEKINSSNPDYVKGWTEEAYVLGNLINKETDEVEKVKILINNEGFRVAEITKNKKKTYEFEDEYGNIGAECTEYLRYDNKGNIIERIPVSTESGDDNQ